MFRARNEVVPTLFSVKEDGFNVIKEGFLLSQTGGPEFRSLYTTYYYLRELLQICTSDLL